MARTLGLSAYLAFARREVSHAPDTSTSRPDGCLIWLHCADVDRANALIQLGLRLCAQRMGHSLLITTSPGRPAPSLPEGVIWQEAPGEHPNDARAFLDHWKPDACLWLGPWLRPSLIDAAHKLQIPLFLLDADEPGLEHTRWRLLLEPVKGTLALFTKIFAHSETAAMRIRRTLSDSHPVQKSGPLLEEHSVLPCNSDDLEELREALKGRPVWFGAHLHPSELRAVLDAHRSNLRLSHRLLLVLAPEAPEDAPLFKERCLEDGWRIAEWDEGEFPDGNTQILLGSDPRELGLWYRISPVTYMGSSLVSGLGGRNPFEPAALGSAILYGPSVRRHLESYSRLVEEGAARIVRDADSLGTALALLTAPDRAAQMAHAGWRVVSEGAEVSDQIINLVQDALDAKETS